MNHRIFPSPPASASPAADWLPPAALFLRLALGATLFWRGIDKVSALEQTHQLLSARGWSPDLAVIAVLIEVQLGVLLIAGYKVRWICALALQAELFWMAGGPPLSLAESLWAALGAGGFILSGWLGAGPCSLEAATRFGADDESPDSVCPRECPDGRPGTRGAPLPTLFRAGRTADHQ